MAGWSVMSPGQRGALFIVPATAPTARSLVYKADIIDRGFIVRSAVRTESRWSKL
jgi:hypothetical protein